MQFTHECSVVVEASARDIYVHWSEVSALPRYLSHLRATAPGEAEDLARLVIVLDGRHIEFPAQRTMCDETTLCWQSLGEIFLYVLTVRVQPHRDGGAQVTVNVAYDPPGFLPDIMETMGLRKVFQRTLDADLRRYAEALKSRHVPALAAAE